MYDSLTSLFSEDGIDASGKEDVFGCFFGRDTSITVLKIIKSCSNKSKTFSLDHEKLLAVCRRSLLTMARLQGKEINPDSGEEPGKFVHEFRRNNLERVLKTENKHWLDKPWFIYPDGILRNYDSIDSTPLGLIAIYKYYQLTKDKEFLLEVLPAVKKGLAWIKDFGDLDNDYLLEYRIHPDRKYGGLVVHSWTDSHESVTQASGLFPKYPIAPVEVQGYAWLALKLWGKFFKRNQELAESSSYYSDLFKFARLMKDEFNKKFIFINEGLYYAAQALDGDKNRIETLTGNPLLLLWASYRYKGIAYSILDRKYVVDLVTRAFKKDLFDKHAGIRTMSSKSLTYNPGQDSYHNGSFWPKLNGMAYEGLVKWRMILHAKKLKSATIKPIRHFGTPIELYIRNKNGEYIEYKGKDGITSSKNQAWSAAVVLDLLTERKKRHLHQDI